VSASQPLPLYTSGLGEGLPEGLYVGELVSVETEMEGLFQRGTVRLQESLRHAREVVVLIPLDSGV
jgi:cell shape-determining protein MreC